MYFAAPEIFTRCQRRGAGDCLDRRFFDPGTLMIYENMLITLDKLIDGTYIVGTMYHVYHKAA